VLTTITARFCPLALLHQRMGEVAGAAVASASRTVVHLLRIRTTRQGGLLALRIFDEATICMAFVICAVFLTDLMRRRMSRVLGMGA
jgi:hypothetical protein